MTGSIHSLFRPVAAICFAILWAESAQAMTVACNTITPDITGFVTNTSACELPDPSDPDHLVNDSADNLNTDELFGITDWTFIAKSEAEPMVSRY